MTSLHTPRFASIVATTLAWLALAGCGSGDPGPERVAPVTIAVAGPNAVSTWNQVATDTINQPAAATGTDAERRPVIDNDLATVHLAIYDALTAIVPTYRPFRVTPLADASGASQEAAVAAAAYGVLSALYPSRSALYRPAYDSALAAVTDATARAKGVAIGAEVAQATVAWRASDGRTASLPAFVPGTTPGAFRGPALVNRDYPMIRPFVLASVSQFRAPGPQALTSATYARDVNETRTLGGTVSSTRTATQLEIARFHTESPAAFWPRNLRRFATTAAPLIDQARLMAMLTVSLADAQLACFDSKYFYLFWRPLSAIPLADTDGNDATTADTTWTPVLPTPPHPEYPAAHACGSSAVAQALATYYRTDQVSYTFDSTVTGSTHAFTSTGALVDEIVVARIAGGMHFRSALVDGASLGQRVATQVLQGRFERR